MLFRTRRTIKPKAMDPLRPVPAELLTEILEDAHWAPCHGLNCPWRFHVFTGEARVKLGEELTRIYDILTPENSRREEKRDKLWTQAQLAPVCIAVGACVASSKISEMDEIAATACAVQNLLLSAHLHGLGSFWSSPEAGCSRELAEWLGLDPATHRMLGIVYVGYPLDGQVPTASSRCPLSERVFFHTE